MYDFFKQEESNVRTERRMKTSDFEDDLKDRKRVDTIRHKFKAVVQESVASIDNDLLMDQADSISQKMSEVQSNYEKDEQPKGGSYLQNLMKRYGSPRKLQKNEQQSLGGNTSGNQTLKNNMSAARLQNPKQSLISNDQSSTA